MVGSVLGTGDEVVSKMNNILDLYKQIYTMLENVSERDQWGTGVLVYRWCLEKPHLSSDPNKGRKEQAMQIPGRKQSRQKEQGSVLGTVKATK